MASEVLSATYTRSFQSLGSTVTVTLDQPDSAGEGVVDEVIEFFAQLQAACTRFVATSPLMCANAEPHRWHQMPAIAVDVLRCAHEAHIATGGLFDPRVHDALVAYGYATDRTSSHTGTGTIQPADAGAVAVVAIPVRTPDLEPWELSVRGSTVHLGGSRIDLGGIGKGYAVRRAVAMLEDHAAGVLINAGGDIGVSGLGPFDGYWNIGIEDPFDSTQTRAVLRVARGGVATSSVRVHRWQTSLGPAHHIIDPRTGAPSESGMRSVTVADADPMWAEVWSKALFIAGPAHIRALTGDCDQAVYWTDDHNGFHANSAAQSHEVWVRDVA